MQFLTNVCSRVNFYMYCTYILKSMTESSKVFKLLQCMPRGLYKTKKIKINLT